MNASHMIYKKELELSIDATKVNKDDKPLFDISLGTGFTSKTANCSVNVELNNLSLDDLKEIHMEIGNIIEWYSIKSVEQT